MKIKELTLEELNTEIARAEFWVLHNPIEKSIQIIDKMKKRRAELLKDNE